MAMLHAIHSSGPQPKSPKQRLWRVLRDCHQATPIGLIFSAAEIEPELFHSLLDCWVHEGYLLTHINPLRFSVTRKGRMLPKPPAQKTKVPKNSGRQRLWAAMRVLKIFDLPTLKMVAETSEKGTMDYLRLLMRCGYVRPDSERQNYQGPIYRLICNTGPSHPVIRVEGDMVFCTDPNNGSQQKTPLPTIRHTIRRDNCGGVS